MPSFSEASKRELATCDPLLQAVFEEVIKHFDCTILEGHRGEAKQNAAFNTGKSKVRYPYGKHNAIPSRAVDVSPFPIDWSDRERMTLFAGFVMGIATGKGIRLRWGGDWNQNTQVKDNRFDDLVHFELAL